MSSTYYSSGVLAINNINNNKSYKNTMIKFLKCAIYFTIKYSYSFYKTEFLIPSPQMGLPGFRAKISTVFACWLSPSFLSFFSFFFTAAPAANGSSLARGQIRGATEAHATATATWDLSHICDYAVACGSLTHILMGILWGS